MVDDVNKDDDDDDDNQVELNIGRSQSGDVSGTTLQASSPPSYDGEDGDDDGLEDVHDETQYIL